MIPIFVITGIFFIIFANLDSIFSLYRKHTFKKWVRGEISRLQENLNKVLNDVSSLILRNSQVFDLNDWETQEFYKLYQELLDSKEALASVGKIITKAKFYSLSNTIKKDSSKIFEIFNYSEDRRIKRLPVLSY